MELPARSLTLYESLIEEKTSFEQQLKAKETEAENIKSAIFWLKKRIKLVDEHITDIKDSRPENIQYTTNDDFKR